MNTILVACPRCQANNDIALFDIMHDSEMEKFGDVGDAGICWSCKERFFITISLRAWALRPHLHMVGSKEIL